MWPFKKEKSSPVKDNFQSRKYRITLFWNWLAATAVVTQSLLSWLGITIHLPLEIIVGIAGTLSAAYLGINLLEKKFLPDSTDKTPAADKP